VFPNCPTFKFNRLCFLGTIDEVALYNYALSSNHVAAHYAIGISSSVLIGVQQIPGGKIVLTWPYGTLQSATNVTGPYTTTDVPGATSPFTNTISGPKRFFRVHVP
jgi:hypothetical protein